MIRIDDEKGEKEGSSSILFLWKKQWREVMHGTKKRVLMHQPWKWS